MDCTMQEAIDIIASDSAIGEIVDERLAQAGAYPREALVSLKKHAFLRKSTPLTG